MTNSHIIYEYAIFFQYSMQTTAVNLGYSLSVAYRLHYFNSYPARPHRRILNKHEK